jgi:hypothetical protein
MRRLHFKVLPAVFIAMAMLTFLNFSAPSLVNAEKMSPEEEREMRIRNLKQQMAGETPTIKPGMSYEERLYIRKLQQKEEAQKQQQQAQPQPPRHQPPSPPPPQPRQQEQRQRHDSGDAYRDHQGSRPPDRNYAPPPEARHRPPPSRHRSFDFDDHRRRHCLRIWEGRGYQYNRCMDGDYVYMYPSRSYDRDTSIFIGIPAPPPIIRYQQPMWPERIRSGRFPTWYMPLVSDDATITAQDSNRNYRSFHLLGIRTGDDQEFAASCISRNLTDSSIQVNEIVTTRRYERADVEAVVISNNAILNIQILADGCAEFDDSDCDDMGQDFCDSFRDAEEYARRNRIGIWR